MVRGRVSWNDREKYKSANRSSLIQLVGYIFHRLYSNAPKLTDIRLLVYSTFKSYAVSTSRSQTKNLERIGRDKVLSRDSISCGIFEKRKKKKDAAGPIIRWQQWWIVCAESCSRNIITRRGMIPCAEPGGRGG